MGVGGSFSALPACSCNSTEPELFASTMPRLSVSTEPRLSASTEPRLSVSTEPRLSVSTEPRLSVSTEPRLSASTYVVPPERSVLQKRATNARINALKYYEMKRKANGEQF